NHRHAVGAAPLPAAEAPAHHPSVQVFIVEDSKLVQMRLAAMVAELDDIELVGHAETVAEAVEAIPRIHPHMVILDFKMPDGTGFAVLDALKRMTPVPVVAILTNFADEELRRRSLAAGADFFLDKSKQFEELPQILRALQQQRAARHV